MINKIYKYNLLKTILVILLLLIYQGCSGRIEYNEEIKDKSISNTIKTKRIFLRRYKLKQTESVNEILMFPEYRYYRETDKAPEKDRYHEISYNKDNEIVLEAQYLNGKSDGIWRYYDDGLIFKVMEYRRGKERSKYLIGYDYKGNPYRQDRYYAGITTELFKEDKKKQEDKLFLNDYFLYYYDYDMKDEGLIVKMEHYEAEIKKQDAVSYYEYDNRGRLLEVRQKEMDHVIFKTQYQYMDESNRVRSIKTFDKNDRILEMKLFNYNKNEKITRLDYYKENPDIKLGKPQLIWYEKYFYDDSENKIKMERYEGDKLSYYFEYAYNKDGKLITEKRFHNDGTVIEVINFE